MAETTQIDRKFDEGLLRELLVSFGLEVVSLVDGGEMVAITCRRKPVEAELTAEAESDHSIAIDLSNPATAGEQLAAAATGPVDMEAIRKRLGMVEPTMDDVVLEDLHHPYEAFKA